MSTAVFPVLGAVLAPAFGEALGLLWLWASLGALLTVASVLVPPPVMRGSLRQLELELPLETLSVPGEASRSPSPATRRFLAPQLAWTKAVRVSRGALICGMALGGAVALLGMVSLLTDGDWRPSLGFFVVAGALQAFHFPTRRRIRDALETTYDAQLEL